MTKKSMASSLSDAWTECKPYGRMLNMRWKYVEEVPEPLWTQTMELVRIALHRSVNKHYTMTDLEYAEAIWLDRNLPCKGKDQSLQRTRAFSAPGAYTKLNHIWVPAPHEIEPCCKKIQWPGRVSWHWQRHCRSMRHIALKCDVEVEALKKALDFRMRPYITRAWYTKRCPSCGRFIGKKDKFCQLHQFAEDASKEWSDA